MLHVMIRGERPIDGVSDEARVNTRNVWGGVFIEMTAEIGGGEVAFVEFFREIVWEFLHIEGTEGSPNIVVGNVVSMGSRIVSFPKPPRMQRVPPRAGEIGAVWCSILTNERRWGWAGIGYDNAMSNDTVAESRQGSWQ